MTKARIATVKATGERFLVCAVNFDRSTVSLWGNLVAYKVARGSNKVSDCKFEKGKVVQLSEVEMTFSVEITKELADQLFNQTKNAHAAEARAFRERIAAATALPAPPKSALDVKIDNVIIKAIRG